MRRHFIPVLLLGLNFSVPASYAAETWVIKLEKLKGLYGQLVKDLQGLDRMGPICSEYYAESACPSIEPRSARETLVEDNVKLAQQAQKKLEELRGNAEKVGAPVTTTALEKTDAYKGALLQAAKDLETRRQAAELLLREITTLQTAITKKQRELYEGGPQFNQVVARCMDVAARKKGGGGIGGSIFSGLATMTQTPPKTPHEGLVELFTRNSRAPDCPDQAKPSFLHFAGTHPSQPSHLSTVVQTLNEYSVNLKQNVASLGSQADALNKRAAEAPEAPAKVAEKAPEPKAFDKDNVAKAATPAADGKSDPAKAAPVKEAEAKPEKTTKADEKSPDGKALVKTDAAKPAVAEAGAEAATPSGGADPSKPGNTAAKKVGKEASAAPKVGADNEAEAAAKMAEKSAVIPDKTKDLPKVENGSSSGVGAGAAATVLDTAEDKKEGARTRGLTVGAASADEVAKADEAKAPVIKPAPTVAAEAEEETPAPQEAPPVADKPQNPYRPQADAKPNGTPAPELQPDAYKFPYEKEPPVGLGGNKNVGTIVAAKEDGATPSGGRSPAGNGDVVGGDNITGPPASAPAAAPAPTRTPADTGPSFSTGQVLLGVGALAAVGAGAAYLITKNQKKPSAVDATLGAGLMQAPTATQTNTFTVLSNTTVTKSQTGTSTATNTATASDTGTATGTETDTSTDTATGTVTLTNTSTSTATRAVTGASWYSLPANPR